MSVSLANKALRYLINRDVEDKWEANKDEVIVLSTFDMSMAINKTMKEGVPVRYVDLLQDGNALPLEKEETVSVIFGQSHTKRVYPFYENIHVQFEQAQKYGFKFVVLDHGDSYPEIEVKRAGGTYLESPVKRAVDVALTYKLGVILVNPHLYSFNINSLLAHINVHGIIIDTIKPISPATIDMTRRTADVPDMPVWYVASGDENKKAIENIAIDAVHYHHMGVSYSSKEKYVNSLDLLRPKQKETVK